MTPLGGEIARGRYPVKRGGVRTAGGAGAVGAGSASISTAPISRAPLGPRDTPLITAGEAWAQVLRE